MSHKRSDKALKDFYVLVIHHNPRERQRLAAALGQLGYTVLQAEGRLDGLPMTYRMRPNLIFMEIQSDDAESWDTFSHLRAFTDTPTVLLADKPVPSIYQPSSEENTSVLIQPASVAEAIAQGRALCATPSHQTTGSNRMKREKPVMRLSVLLAQEVSAVDHALQEIGECGEVHLAMENGRLRSLTKFKTEPLASDTFLVH